MTPTDFLTDAELQQLRASAERTMDDVCEIWHPTPETVDAAGNTIPGTFELAGEYPCFFRTADVGKQEGDLTVADRPTLETRWRINLPMSAPVKKEDRIVVDGTQFRVRTMMSGGSRAVLQRIEVSRWQ